MYETVLEFYSDGEELWLEFIFAFRPHSISSWDCQWIYMWIALFCNERSIRVDRIGTDGKKEILV